MYEKGIRLVEKTGVIKLKPILHSGYLDFIDLCVIIDINTFDGFDIRNAINDIVNDYTERIYNKYINFINSTIIKSSEYPMFNSLTSKIVLKKGKVESNYYYSPEKNLN